VCRFACLFWSSPLRLRYLCEEEKRERESEGRIERERENLTEIERERLREKERDASNIDLIILTPDI